MDTKLIIDICKIYRRIAIHETAEGFYINTVSGQKLQFKTWQEATAHVDAWYLMSHVITG